MMEVLHTDIEGVVLLRPRVFLDKRGYFLETFSQKEFDSLVRPLTFVQDNQSSSSYGVVRGLHFQKGEFSQGKLVRVVKGRVLDIAVDIRRGSPTFGRYVAVELSEDNFLQLFIPRGFAHGFVVLSDEALFAYKCDNVYMPSAERGIIFNDPDLGIDWRVSPGQWNLSEKDKKHPLLTQIEPWEEAK